MKHRKFTKQQEKDMKEIVDFYMQYVTGEHFSIRESLEYFWKCMSDYTIEDYLEVAREGKANMNNEPVAWIDPKELDMTVSTSVTKSKQFESDIPLYTHPVKEQDVKYDVTVRWDDKITHHKNVSVDTPLHYTHPVKELTDEEILKIFYNIETPRTVSHHKNAIEFARAILRKAQE